MGYIIIYYYMVFTLPFFHFLDWLYSLKGSFVRQIEYKSYFRSRLRIGNLPLFPWLHSTLFIVSGEIRHLTLSAILHIVLVAPIKTYLIEISIACCNENLTFFFLFQTPSKGTNGRCDNALFCITRAQALAV